MTFSLIVFDTRGEGSALAKKEVFLNHPPTIDINVSPSQTVNENTTVTLDASQSNANGPFDDEITKFGWSQLIGPLEMEKAAKQKRVRKTDILPVQNNNYNSQRQATKYYTNSITDKDEIEEIDKIKEILNSNEKVLFVTKQSKIKPGGSYFSPNTIYATNKRIIIRDPFMLNIKSIQISIC